jgi:hypothetical protein
MYLHLVDIIFPVLVAAGIGFAWKKAGRPFDMAMVSGLVSEIAVPCLIVATLARFKLEGGTFGFVALLWLGMMAAFLAAGAALLKVARLPVHTYLPVISFPNTGNLGLPLSLFAFGEEGMALAIAAFCVNSVAQFSLGQWIAAGAMSVRRILMLPNLWAVIAALALVLSGVVLPKAVQNALSLIGNICVPIMLLALGVSLASLRVGGLARSFAFALWRVGSGFVLGVAATEIFGLTGAMRGIVIIQASMSSAVFSYMWAQQFDRDPPAVAGIVVVSTLVNFISLPLILAVALDPAVLPWR